MGRPREFDRDEALKQAMKLFWAQGYEGATLGDLQKAMGGLSAPSFYAAFGSKEQLFMEAVELYNRTEGAPMVCALTEAETARESIRQLLKAVAASFCQSGKPRGCLVVLGAMNCMPANKSVEDFARKQRSKRASFMRQRLQRAVDDGELSPKSDIDELVSFYAGIIDGMAIQARDGASKRILNGMVELAMVSWDAMAQHKPARSRP